MVDYGGVISLSQGRDLSHTSDDDDEEQSPRSATPLAGGAGVGSSRAKMNSKGGGGEMGSMGEIVRKPRGRPPGSKNKPKPPIVITRDSEAAMKPVVLEISAGSDIVEQVVDYARRRHVGLSIMSGCGTISNVTLRHPMAHAPTISLHGPLHIVCLSGTYLGSACSAQSSSSAAAAAAPSSSSSSFSISLAGSQGQVFGGIIAGKVIAQTQVIVVAATFMNPSFHRLPGGEADEADQEIKAGGVGIVGGAGGSESCTSSSMSMSVYNVAAPTPLNCQISPDVLHWGSTPRPHPY